MTRQSSPPRQARRRLVSIIDAQQRQIQFSYDDQARLTSCTGIDGRTERWSYDVGGNVTQHIDADNRPTNYFYDADGRRIQAVYADGRGEGASTGSTRPTFPENNLPPSSATIPHPRHFHCLHRLGACNRASQYLHQALNENCEF